jgi:hypothetical protein
MEICKKCGKRPVGLGLASLAKRCAECYAGAKEGLVMVCFEGDVSVLDQIRSSGRRGILR